MQRSLDTADRDVEKWFRQARNARSMQEMLACLQRAHRLDPYHSQAQQLTRRALWRILQKEPFLAYRDETDHLPAVTPPNGGLSAGRGRELPTTARPECTPCL